MSSQPRKYLSIVQSLKRVVAEEGLRGLYRGNLANVVRVVPTYGFKFAFNDWFRDLVAPGVAKPSTWQLMASGTLAGLSQVLHDGAGPVGGGGGCLVAESSLRNPRCGMPLRTVLGPVRSWVCPPCVCPLPPPLPREQLVISYPLEVVRTRMAVGPSLHPPLVYDGIVHCTKTIVKTEGFRALYVPLAAAPGTSVCVRLRLCAAHLRSLWQFTCARACDYCHASRRVSLSLLPFNPRTIRAPHAVLQQRPTVRLRSPSAPAPA
jgi:hypothetical protein